MKSVHHRTGDRHIPTQLNPADDASRGLSADELINNRRWLSGWDFLWKPETHWPTSSKEPIKILDENLLIKREFQTFATAINTGESPIDMIFKRFSSWERLTADYRRKENCEIRSRHEFL